MKFKRFVAIGDNHGDCGDRETENAARRVIRHFEPDAIIHLGDAFDFRALRAGMSNEDGDAFEDLESDLNAGFAFLERLFDCETKTRVWLLGNHEHRLWRVASDHPRGIMRLAARNQIDRIEQFCKSRKVDLFPYHFKRGVYRLGTAAFVHGYSANLRAAAEHAQTYGVDNGFVAMGHLHRFDTQFAKRVGGCVGHAVGAAGNIDEHFAYAHHRMATHTWEQGFAYGYASDAGSRLFDARRIAGKWITPTL
jgi:hypothetical protein